VGNGAKRFWDKKNYPYPNPLPGRAFSSVILEIFYQASKYLNTVDPSQKHSGLTTSPDIIPEIQAGIQILLKTMDP